MAAKMRESTNLKSDAAEQLVPAVDAGKLTFSQVPLGRYGFPEATSVLVTLVASSAYTDWYVWTAVVQATCDPVSPLKAIPGTPRSEASVAAPTVPEMRTVAPVFAVGEYNM